MKWFKNIFNKKSNQEIEEVLIDNISAENEKEQSNIKVYGILITYIQNEENVPPVIWNLGSFHCEILPEIGSIVWIANEDTNELSPWKVVRFDFIEDLNIDNAIYPYIVVVKASQNDITRISYDE